MSKKRKKVQPFDFMHAIHESLRTDFACTEEQIELIDHALKGEAPAHVIEHMKDIHEGKVPLPERPQFIIDMGDGSSLGPFSLANHPITLLADYLEEKYGEAFGTLYWGAITPSNAPKNFYQFLRLLKKAPMWTEMKSREAEQ